MSIVKEAKSINESLQRVKETIKAGVLQVEAAHSTVLTDGVAIKGSLNEHKYVLKSALDSTNNRLRRIKNAEQREKYMILSSFLFFACTVLYIFLKRVGVLHYILSFTCS